MAQHTPGPWELDKTMHDGVATIGVNLDSEPDGFSIADVCSGDVYQTLADAEFIVRACNAHDALLAACSMAREELVFGGDWETAKRIIDAAIAKAEPKA